MFVVERARTKRRWQEGLAVRTAEGRDLADNARLHVALQHTAAPCLEYVRRVARRDGNLNLGLERLVFDVGRLNLDILMLLVEFGNGIRECLMAGIAFGGDSP